MSYPITSSGAVQNHKVTKIISNENFASFNANSHRREVDLKVTKNRSNENFDSFGDNLQYCPQATIDVDFDLFLYRRLLFLCHSQCTFVLLLAKHPGLLVLVLDCPCKILTWSSLFAFSDITALTPPAQQESDNSGQRATKAYIQSGKYGNVLWRVIEVGRDNIYIICLWTMWQHGLQRLRHKGNVAIIDVHTTKRKHRCKWEDKLIGTEKWDSWNKC